MYDPRDVESYRAKHAIDETEFRQIVIDIHLTKLGFVNPYPSDRAV